MVVYVQLVFGVSPRASLAANPRALEVVGVELVLLVGLAVRCEARVRGVRAVRRRANLRGRG